MSLGHPFEENCRRPVKLGVFVEMGYQKLCVVVTAANSLVVGNAIARSDSILPLVLVMADATIHRRTHFEKQSFDA